MRQGEQCVDDNLAFLSAFQDEVADFHMACADSGATDAAERVLSHVGTLRAMVSDAEGDDAAMLKEMHAACVAKAAAWVERRIQDLVAQFHLRWHDDGDLLAVDCALRESMTLVRHAEAELGPLPVCVEVLGGCDQQLCTKLAEHVRRANRHELRMLFADFCQWVGREELQQLCLDKYREQVDKHVQSEAVATQIKLLNLLQAKSLRTSPKPARTSARVKLETYCQTLACAYSAGEAAYLGCAVRLAMEMAEADRESLTLSVVDDGFFVLLKAFGRAVRSGAATLAVVPLLHSMVDAIRTLIAPVLGRYVRQAGLADAANEPFLIAVNSLQCAEEYTRKLRSVVSSAFEERFNGLVGLADAAQSELDGIADDLKEDAAKELRHLGASLLPAVWLRMEFEPTSYVLAAEQAELDAKRSFESGLLRPLREALEPLKDRLRAVNFESLVHTLAAGLAEELEAAVMHKRFDEAGAILLGEHSRQLTDNLSELLVSGSVRNEFGRLNQIAFLLTAGSVQEAAALMLSTQSAAAGPGARLTRAEAARALVLRKEFTMAEVREILPELDDEDEG